MDDGQRAAPHPPDTTVSPLAVTPWKRAPLVTALGPGPPMSLQGRVSPPSSEGRASPTPVPPESGVGVGLDPHGLTGQGRAARPHPPTPALPLWPRASALGPPALSHSWASQPSTSPARSHRRGPAVGAASPGMTLASCLLPAHIQSSRKLTVATTSTATSCCKPGFLQEI